MENKLLLNGFKESLSYLKESKVHIIIITALFIGTLLIGYIAPVFFTESIRNLLKDLVNETEGMNFPQLFVYIFQNNLKTAFLGVILGSFLGIIPIFYTIINGYILGFVSSKAAEVYGAQILLRLLPHGIFELPALIISLSIGLKLGMFFLTTKKKAEGFIAYIATIFSSGIILSVFLLFLSAIISSDIDIENLLSTPIFLTLFFFLAIVAIIVSLFIGFAILSKKEKINVKDKFRRDFEYSLKTFLFIILPLLLVAGIIETVLIIFFE